MKTAGLISVFSLLALLSVQRPANAEWLTFTEELMAAAIGAGIPDSDHVEIEGISQPVRRIRLAYHGTVDSVRVTAQVTDSVEITGICQFDEYRFYDVPTSAGLLDMSAFLPSIIDLSGHPACGVVGITRIGGFTFVDIAIATVMRDSLADRVWLASEFAIDVDVNQSCGFPNRAVEGTEFSMIRALSQSAVSPDSAVPAEEPELSNLPGLTGGESARGYVIITDSSLVAAFEPLARWKMQLGYASSIVTVQRIAAEYSGIDQQERIRNYLIEAYSHGARWVLLGGNETIIPIRYACHVDRSKPLTIENQQVCDLYYADVDGIWDADGDGLYGEPTQDRPDRTPELMIGRALVSSPEPARIFVEKTIGYELNFAAGDTSFASRVLIASADQMRDYMQVGQAELIAERLPHHLNIDAETLAETPTGNDAAPISPLASTFIDELSVGANLTFVLCHGAVDGFVTKSSYYDQWPKSFVFTRDEAPVGHGTIDDLTNVDRYGIVYSIGCSNGAFDLDNSPFEYDYPCVAEKFLADSASGAAAFVGNSRWGWVATSYRLAIDFNDYLYGYDNRLASANSYSKLNNPSSVDLAYGLNVYGDPSLRVWTSAPQPVVVSAPENVSIGHNRFDVVVSSAGSYLAGATVTIVGSDSLLCSATTDDNGMVIVDFQLESDSAITITASKNGYIPAIACVGVTIVLDADDDRSDGIPPALLVVDQNYPNPFNPTTEIQFTCALQSDVSFEVFNILGQAVLESCGEQMSAGKHSITVDASAWPSGVYFYKITVEGQSEVRKMTLVK